MVYIHNGTLLSHEKDDILPSVATWMDLEGIMLKWNKQNIKRQILHDITSIIEPEKYNKVVNITKNEQTDRYREQTSDYKWGRGWKVKTTRHKTGSKVHCVIQGI